MRENSFLAVLIALALSAAAPLAAAPKPENLTKIKSDIAAKQKESAALEKEQARIAAELRTTQDKLVAVAAGIKKHESQLAEYDRRLAALERDRQSAMGRLSAGNERLVGCIAAAERLAVLPKGYLILGSRSAEDTFKTSLLLRSVISQLAEIQDAFRSTIARLSALEAEIVDAKLAIASSNAKIKAERAKLDALVRAKKVESAKLDDKRTKNAKELARLVRESKSIEDFIKKAEALKKSSGAAAVVKSFSGNVAMPVGGTISTYYGEPRGGVKSKGLYVKIGAGRQVVAPVDSEVVFAGNFLGYKNLMILHGADGFYIILGGLAEVHAAETQSLLAGEPIGLTADGEFYIEIRDGINTINPVKYFKM